MVKAIKLVPEIAEDHIDIPDPPLKWSSVSVSEVLTKSNRLEASVFGVDIKIARQTLQSCVWPVVNLWSDEGLVLHAQYPGRFKRIYVEPQNGYPFYLPSQISDLYPKPNKWISPITHSGIDILKAKSEELLLNRSGTIGPVSIVSKTLDGQVLSDDVIRIRTREKSDTGYLYAFLRSNIGQILLTTNSYGAVISHIEPEHLRSLPIPNPETSLKQDINKLIVQSFDARDRSNELIDKAEALLTKELNLSSDLLSKSLSTSAELDLFNVKLSGLNNRLDGSYHNPLVQVIERHLSKNAAEVTTVGDKRISSKIFIPGRFKRIYVMEGQGAPYFGGKNIGELDPSNKKYISRSVHSDRIANFLTVRHNMVLVTCSGTVAKCVLAPKHWDGWVMTHDIIRIIPSSMQVAGYIYCWLNTVFGNTLIKRHNYGAVVDHIEAFHLAQVPIPILKSKEIQQEINELVLKANDLRFSAYALEQKAIDMVNELVIYANTARMAAGSKVKYIKQIKKNT